MQLAEWIAGTNQILMKASQDLPQEYVSQLRRFQQVLMVNHLQSGFLTVGADRLQGHFTSYEFKSGVGQDWHSPKSIGQSWDSVIRPENQATEHPQKAAQTFSNQSPVNTATTL